MLTNAIIIILLLGVVAALNRLSGELERLRIAVNELRWAQPPKNGFSCDDYDRNHVFNILKRG